MPLRFDLVRRLEPIRPGADLDARVPRRDRRPAVVPRPAVAAGRAPGRGRGVADRGRVPRRHDADRPARRRSGPRSADRLRPRRSSSPSPATGGRRAAGARSAGGGRGSCLPDAPAGRRRRCGSPACRVPYDALRRVGYDGRALYAARAGARAARRRCSPRCPRREPADLWDPAELAYSAPVHRGRRRAARASRGTTAATSTGTRSTPPRRCPRRDAAPTPADVYARPAEATRARRTRAGGRSRTPRSTSAASRPTAATSRRCCSSTSSCPTPTTGSPSRSRPRPGTVVTLDRSRCTTAFDERDHAAPADRLDAVPGRRARPDARSWSGRPSPRR